MTKQHIGEQISKILEDVPKSYFLSINHEHDQDFNIPLYSVWNFQAKTKGSDHFGNTEVTIVDNLLYRYTEPFDVVVDPFAGGGSTMDICKKRLRRYWASDREVKPALEGKIREWDITEGLPPLSRWKDVSLVLVALVGFLYVLPLDT